ncbi:hypothetical protein F5J12DRAFT_717496 [Pisolithus orientalis]|uniref:uncharacterized protein n=1 Tax=Pisolithus orientalis TaxID=936130 RepID=UPI0022254008|nr:uncharacterized protein F5J12DRAFT_717496 [Pisolithus orientalis]KAI6015367.1 hypothetical protein F5J12DRAFT_717496 [Pisolithus orientalis]
MSTMTVFGFFALSGGQLVQSLRPGATSKTYHCLYNTTARGMSSVVFPVQLQVYSPFNNSVHVDDTVAFVVARTYALTI